ncbi:MAG: hypothetical protein K0M45_03055 [Candidatus Paracaedibacteraceae bacterium]|nr:hypothetical protein [Candidatus Paracaedibacteraceae bacterium]
MNYKLLMTVLLLGRLTHAFEESSSSLFPSSLSIPKPYENSEIWAPGSPFQGNGVNIFIFQAPANFSQKLMELSIQLSDEGASVNPTPSNSAFSLFSFTWSPLPFKKEDCSKLESITLMQQSQAKRKSTTLFMMDPLSHLLWWGFGE